ncbi:MAG TPA: rhomboid family intramembrane serine protease [Burkholderiales bacterium]|nr:rhomboid family intramembrane serine protease [Burkholderiales bacterium]
MALVEVYRSHRRADCDERALVLAAVGVASELVSMGDSFALLVPEESIATASTHLKDYGEESLSRQREPRPISAHPGAWLGSAGYALVLVSVTHCAAGDLLGLDWFSSGELVSGLLRRGELWRVVTALTLHADFSHLLTNLGFGMLFGYLAGQLLGPGIAWASIVAAGAFGNFLDALLMPPTHRAIGASTAVFATLGLLAAYSWRRRSGPSARWPYRWAPLIAAVALLALLGAGGEHTDVLAHLTGFFAGTVFGVVYGSLAILGSGRAPTQLLAGASALAAIVGAWVWALIRG